MIAHLIAYEGRGVHFRSASDAARRLLKQAALHQAEWNYGRQEQIDNIARKQWGRWWRKKLDGVSSLEYSIELAHRQPINALTGIPLALASAAQHYLSWYERTYRSVTYDRVYHDYTQWTSEESFQLLMTELFGKLNVTNSNMTAKDVEIKAQLHAMNEGSAMAIHEQVYDKLGITPTSPAVATPKRPKTGMRPSTAASSSTASYGGDVTATSHPPTSGPSSTPSYYSKPRLMPPPMPAHGSGAHAAWLPSVPPAPSKWIPRPATTAPAQGADATADAKPAIPLPPPPKVPGQRGPYPTAAGAATHAARTFWRPAD
jgi:hypothetical protein